MRRLLFPARAVVAALDARPSAGRKRTERDSLTIPCRASRRSLLHIRIGRGLGSIRAEIRRTVAGACRLGGLHWQSLAGRTGMQSIWTAGRNLIIVGAFLSVLLAVCPTRPAPPRRDARLPRPDTFPPSHGTCAQPGPAFIGTIRRGRCDGFRSLCLRQDPCHDR